MVAGVAMCRILWTNSRSFRAPLALMTWPMNLISDILNRLNIHSKTLQLARHFARSKVSWCNNNATDTGTANHRFKSCQQWPGHRHLGTPQSGGSVNILLLQVLCKNGCIRYCAAWTSIWWEQGQKGQQNVYNSRKEKLMINNLITKMIVQAQ